MFHLIILTYFIKFALAVDFILVNKSQHDPITDNGTLNGRSEMKVESESVFQLYK